MQPRKHEDIFPVHVMFQIKSIFAGVVGDTLAVLCTCRILYIVRNAIRTYFR